MLPIPILIGMLAHASRWAIISVAGASVETGALVACLGVGTIITPIADRLRLPDRKFNRGIGMYSSVHFDPQGHQLPEEEWARRKHEWLPAPKDREYLLSIQAAPVYEPSLN